jgi:hypothetical protein
MKLWAKFLTIFCTEELHFEIDRCKILHNVTTMLMATSPEAHFEIMG